MVSLILRGFDRLAWALRLAGVDYSQFRNLLEIKLTLDGRRRFTAFRQKEGRAPSSGFAFALLMNVLMGTMMAMLIPMSTSPLTTMTLVHAFIMVMVSMSLVADFSSVLLDTTDNQILQPRPIDSRTILAARIAHILTYITLLTLSLAAVSFLTGTFEYGFAFPVVFALTLAASVCLVVGAVNVLYLLAMRLTTGEKLRDVILYAQMGMTIVVIGGYQILPRLIRVQEVGAWSLADSWWIYLVPPAWLAAPVELLTGNTGRPMLALSTLGVVLPLATLFLAMVLAPGFREALARLDAAPAVRKSDRPRAGGGRFRGAAWLARRPEERAAVEFYWSLSGRDRQFKLRTYPSVAMVLIFSAGFLLSDPRGVREAFATLAQSQKHLFVLYMCCVLAPTAFIQMRYSDGFEAAWIYRVLPLATPGVVLRAGLKVVIVRLVMPSFAIVTLVTLWIWGGKVIPDVLLAFCATLLTCALQALLIGNRFPFSEPYGAMDSAGRIHRSLSFFLLPLILGGVHYLLEFIPYGVPIATPVVALGAWLALEAYGRRPWRFVMQEEKPTIALPVANPIRP